MTRTLGGDAGATGPALSALRAATAQAHRELEGLLQLTGGAPALTLRRYGAVLCGFDRFLGTWEPAVRALLGPALQRWFDARSRRAMLAADLAALGLVAADVPVPLPSWQLAAEAWGSMYVLEGSALGGQVIAQALHRSHGLDATHGARYFCGHGAETGRLWREFRQRLGQTLDGDDSSTRLACAAAADTFETLAAVFRATPQALPVAAADEPAPRAGALTG